MSARGKQPRKSKKASADDKLKRRILFKEVSKRFVLLDRPTEEYIESSESSDDDDDNYHYYDVEPPTRKQKRENEKQINEDRKKKVKMEGDATPYTKDDPLISSSIHYSPYSDLSCAHLKNYSIYPPAPIIKTEEGADGDAADKDMAALVNRSVSTKLAPLGFNYVPLGDDVQQQTHFIMVCCCSLPTHTHTHIHTHTIAHRERREEKRRGEKRAKRAEAMHTRMHMHTHYHTHTPHTHTERERERERERGVMRDERWCRTIHGGEQRS